MGILEENSAVRGLTPLARASPWTEDSNLTFGFGLNYK